ncbi:hypothetical protein RQP46_010510 [Phenoliferia psychrophenolica]
MQLLEDEIAEFRRYIEPTEFDLQLRAIVVKLVSRVVHTLWPDATCEVVGSSVTGTCLPDGDIDLYIQTRSQTSAAEAHHLLNRLSKALLAADLVPSAIVSSFPAAGAPNLRIKMIPDLGSVSCDIKLNSYTGCQEVDVMNHLRSKSGGTEQWERARTLIYLVKAFLKRRNLMGMKAGGLSGRAVAAMVVFLFQMEAKLSRRYSSCGTDLINFFAFYGNHFGYQHGVISLSAGGLTRDKRIVCGNFKDAARPFALAIQDPLDPGRNLTLGATRIDEVKVAFRSASTALTPYSDNSSLIRLHTLPPSMLSQIGITATTGLRQRRAAFLKLELSIDALLWMEQHWKPDITRIASKKPSCIKKSKKRKRGDLSLQSLEPKTSRPPLLSALSPNPASSPSHSPLYSNGLPEWYLSLYPSLDRARSGVVTAAMATPDDPQAPT